METDSSNQNVGPTKGNWKAYPATIALITFFFVVTSGSLGHPNAARRLLAWIVLAASALIIFWFCRTALIQRHPANAIARLLSAGDNEQAYVKGAALLKQTPDDPLVQLNCVAAMYRTGREQEARDLFARIRTEGLPKPLRRVYDGWQTTVGV
jgi:tetratricopeptide repeat protein